MKKLWAPWRSKYIYQRKKKKCIFCVSKKGTKKYDRQRYILFRSEFCFSMLNKFPYNNGHIMIAPYRHVSSIELFKKDELSDLTGQLTFLKKLLDKKLKPQGYNLGANIGKIAGAGFAGHFHLHIVPRWNGDTNFMPVISGTKVISESLDTLYKLLKK